MFEHSLQRALYVLFQPALHLSPIRLSAHLFSVVLPFLLLGGGHTSSSGFILSSGLDQPWAHRFHCLLRLLCFSQDQFSRLVSESAAVASIDIAEEEEKEEEEEANFKKACTEHLQQKRQFIASTRHIQPRTSFAARPTLLLRVVIPQTGYSVVVRACVDTGQSTTTVTADLANLLVANGAQSRFIWPHKVILYFGGHRTDYRALDGHGLLLQSVEQEEGQEEEQPKGVQLAALAVDESRPCHQEQTHLPSLVRVLTKRGVLPKVMDRWHSLVTGESGERAMWSEELTNFW